MTHRRPPLAVVALLLSTLVSGCASGALKRAQQADELRDFDLAVANYTKAVRDHPNNVDARAGLERAKLRASDAHLFRGRRFLAQGRYDDALVELEIASELNPTSEQAAQELQKAHTLMRTELKRTESSPTELEALIDRTRDLPPAGYEVPDVRLPAQILTGQQSTSRDVYLMLARLGNLSVTFDSQFRDTAAPVSLLSGMTLRQALDAVATATNTFYQVTGPSTIIVIPDTPAKRREYTDEVMRQFTLQNADLKETLDALRIVADARYIAPVTATNSILVRDTPERVRAIGRFISQFDKAKPEVVVDVEVLEVDRTRLQEYGLQIASPGQSGVSGTVDINQANGVSLQAIRNLTDAGILLTNIPALYYHLLKTDSRTRTLANPHIRITDGTQATARFGEDVPVPQVTITPVSQGGPVIQPETQYTYRTVGVNIGITPRTHPNDEVTLALNIELSSLGSAGYNGLPTFGNRNITTSIRLRDGETNILAGLIRDDERTEKDSIPGIGEVPVLGSLFARNHKEAEQTDVVVMLTPHIVRTLNLTEDDLRPLRLPNETGASILEPSPILPVPSATTPIPRAEPPQPAQPNPQAPGAPPYGGQTPQTQTPPRIGGQQPQPQTPIGGQAPQGR